MQRGATGSAAGDASGGVSGGASGGEAGGASRGASRGASGGVDHTSRTEIERLQQLLRRASASADAAEELWDAVGRLLLENERLRLENVRLHDGTRILNMRLRLDIERLKRLQLDNQRLRAAAGDEGGVGAAE